jgi:hypothetical protein
MLNKIINKLLDIFGPKDWDQFIGPDGLVMRRRLPGRWEYRSPTPAEVEDIAFWQALK